MNSTITSYFDSTYLKTNKQAFITLEEDKERIKLFVQEAIDYNFKLVMIRANHVSFAKEIIRANKSHVLVGTVIDFPNGDSTTENKLIEIQAAIDLEADDIDVVINYKRFIEGDAEYVAQEVNRCTSLCLENNKTIKWIIESVALNNNQIISICQLIKDVVLQDFGSENVKNVFVKSSTGFFVTSNSKPNGATKESIKIMIEHSMPLPVKASGGIRSLSDFNAMIDLGVKRIGTSSALAILQGKKSDTSY